MEEMEIRCHGNLRIPMLKLPNFDGVLFGALPVNVQLGGTDLGDELYVVLRSYDGKQDKWLSTRSDCINKLYVWGLGLEAAHMLLACADAIADDRKCREESEDEEPAQPPAENNVPITIYVPKTLRDRMLYIESPQSPDWTGIAIRAFEAHLEKTNKEKTRGIVREMKKQEPDALITEEADRIAELVLDAIQQNHVHMQSEAQRYALARASESCLAQNEQLWSYVWPQCDSKSAATSELFREVLTRLEKQKAYQALPPF